MKQTKLIAMLFAFLFCLSCGDSNGIDDGDAIYYTVTFDTNGGTEISAVEVKSGSKLTEPTNTTKEGYALKGWCSDSELTTEWDFSTAVMCDMTLYAVWGDEYDYSIPDVILQFAKDGHPWMLFEVDEISDVKRRIYSKAWTRALYSQMEAESETLLTGGYYPFTFGSSADTSGRRLGYICLNLLFTGYMTGNLEHINYAKSVMMSAIERTHPGEWDSSTTTTSANTAMAAGTSQSWSGHLQNGDAGYSMAMAYDLLYPFLTDAENQLYLEEMDQMANWLSNADGNGYTGSSYGYTGNFTKQTIACNHTSVHWGPVGLLALMLGEENTSYYSTYMSRTKEMLDAYITLSSDEDGYMMEGHRYGPYGMIGVYPLAHALSRIEGADAEDWFTEYKDPFFSKCGDQLIWLQLPGSDPMNFNENRLGVPRSTQILGALRYGNAQQLDAWLEVGGYNSTGVFDTHDNTWPYSRPFIFTMDPIDPETPTEASHTLSKRFESGRAFARTSWDSDAAVVGFTSGRDYASAHNQEDENQITFFALGTQFLYDPDYEARFSPCHSLPTIDGINQTRNSTINTHGTMGKIEDFEERGEGVFIYGKAIDSDIDGAYPEAYGKVKMFDRKAYFRRDTPTQPYLIFRDDIELTSGSSVECITRYVTAPDNRISSSSDGSVIIYGESTTKAARIYSFSGATQVTLKEESLAGRTLIDDDTSSNSSSLASKYYDDAADYFKRITGSVTAVNPRFTTLVLPYASSSDLPSVAVAESGDDIIYTLTYESGEIHTITLKDDDITVATTK